MAGKTTKKSAKVVKKAAPKRVGAKGATLRKGAAASSPRKPTKKAATGLRKDSPGQELASERITARILELGDWRGEKLALVRRLIHEADPGILEEWKWETPVWSHDGIVCTGETYKQVVKLTFAKGAFLADPHRLFNSGLTGNVRRALDLRAQDEIDGPAFRELVREAVAFNQDVHPKQRRAAKTTGAPGKGEGSTATRSKAPLVGAKPVLLSGGNPQIAKADGDAPVQAYIAAMPGWKRDVGRRLDALIVRTVPNVRKAVRWNSPFYGTEGRGWFLGFHTFTNYVKVSFFQGTSLRPVPPGGEGKDARWIDIHKDDLDDAQMAMWIRRAAALPGWGKS